MREMTIYSRGIYRVVPLIRGYVVKGPSGVVDRYNPDEIEDAVELVDELATGVGERVA